MDLLALRIALNEVARLVLRVAVVLVGHLLEIGVELRIRGHAHAQEKLRRLYRIEPSTPILAWGDEVRAAVERFAAAHPEARFAYTSGSTSSPKKIAFTPARLATIKRGSFSVAARLVAQHPSWRTGLFILSSLKTDDSLTSLLLDVDADLPPWPIGLVMPARYLRAREVARLVERFGATATRLWLLALCDPGIVYSTNPSTLAVFLGEVQRDWARASALVRDWVAQPATRAALARVVGRVAAPGFAERFARIAAATGALPVAAWAPGLRAYCCWDGGYVRPFLDEVQRHLPPERYRFVPMYSMSTETVETLNYYDGDQVRFLPLAPGVLYEFLPEGAADRPEHLLPACALEPGRVYAMVVSDGYGLRRYQTDDLFLCRARVGDVPDLAFLRRRGLSYSFTGEKLTDLQLGEAFEALRAELPALRDAGVQLTCLPSRPDGDALPCYRLVLACPGRAIEPDGVAARFDAHLSRINREFAAKLESGRLGPTRAEVMGYDALAAQLDAKTAGAEDRARRTWDSQFKLLPLYRRTWEEYGFR